MNFARALTILLLFTSISGFTQVNSYITGSTESLQDPIPVKLLKAQYDASKNFLPFYQISKRSTVQRVAIPTLAIKRVSSVSPTHAAVLKRHFADFLKNDFYLEDKTARHKNENINSYRLFPFRIKSGIVEELVEYQVSWQEIASAIPVAARQTSSFVQSSVLANGTWYKIGVTNTGIHRITKTMLSNMGINTSNLDPSKIRIFGNGGKMLPEKNGSPRHDDLVENAIYISGANDGSFDNNDYILFYATSTTEWKTAPVNSAMKFTAVTNMYSDTSFYFITTDLPGNGLRTGTIQSQPQFNTSTTTYDYYTYHEAEIINFGKSGRRFFGELFDYTTQYGFKWSDGNFVTGDTIRGESTIAGVNSDSIHFLVSSTNGLNFNVITYGIDPKQMYAPHARENTNRAKAINNNPNELAFTVTKVTQRGVGWLDKLTINARRHLVASPKQYNFRDTRVSGTGNVCRFTVSNPSDYPNVVLWNVTNPLQPFFQQYATAPEMIEFNAVSDVLNEYCIVSNNDFYTPTLVGKIVNQNLHATQQADYVIITHSLFLKEAQRLALFHQKNDGLSYVIATPEQIYNEFSSGRPDISAIRDFIRMLYSRNLSSGKEVKYVLLIGDGSYNNKIRNLVNNSNLIPTYQGHESLSSTSTVASDDFFVLMDDDEGEFAEEHGAVDIGIGRFPCRNAAEVRSIVDKIENYHKNDPNFTIEDNNALKSFNESTMGDWRNWLMFLSDDGDAALHMWQSDTLAKRVQRLTLNYNIDKIMLDAYQRFSSPGGPRYPDASEDFQRRMKKGALLFNYTGHGGEVGLTGERIIDLEIINSLDNFNKLPLFITATCEFSRYDDPARTSAGELCLLNPKGGAIALMTTCRLAFSSSNFDLNDKILKELFEKRPDGTYPTLGEAMQHTKADLTQGFSYAHFHLLGDPAMRLVYPVHNVITTSVNQKPVGSNSSDTLSALSKVTIGGYVADVNGNKITSFNGVVYPTVFDRQQRIVALVNWSESARNYNDKCDTCRTPFYFDQQKNILYRGKAQVTNGEFSFTFLVPKDISFVPGPGKISYYATNGSTDANGVYMNLVVGGDSRNTITDNEGPAVNIFLNDKNFANGGITNETPVFFAELSDSSGINTVGTGLGHDITVVLDENASKPLVLNDYYEANLNSYQSGRIRYPFNTLSEGEHRLSFKVWDIQNNSSTVYTDFIVAPSAELALQHVLNYPNPFTTQTRFFFQHNQACNPLKVTIQVYTVSGKIVKTIQRSVSCEGYRPEGIEWDGKDDYGDRLGRGVYIYRLAILDINNKKAEKIEKLVILN